MRARADLGGHLGSSATQPFRRKRSKPRWAPYWISEVQRKEMPSAGIPPQSESSVRRKADLHKELTALRGTPGCNARNWACSGASLHTPPQTRNRAPHSVREPTLQPPPFQPVSTRFLQPVAATSTPAAPSSESGHWAQRRSDLSVKYALPCRSEAAGRLFPRLSDAVHGKCVSE